LTVKKAGMGRRGHRCPLICVALLAKLLPVDQTSDRWDAVCAMTELTDVVADPDGGSAPRD